MWQAQIGTMWHNQQSILGCQRPACDKTWLTQNGNMKQTWLPTSGCQWWACNKMWQTWLSALKGRAKSLPSFSRADPCLKPLGNKVHKAQLDSSLLRQGKRATA
eukprot:1161840-Pelagomonas_calceolata.AAC.24